MTRNPYGAVQLNDFGAPNVISAGARVNVSGGNIVYTSGANSVVSSGADSFVTTDIKVNNGASGGLYTGVALADIASGGIVPVATNGVFILTARENIVAGNAVGAAGDEAVATMAVLGEMAGRALTNGASGGFVVVRLI